MLWLFSYFDLPDINGLVGIIFWKWLKAGNRKFTSSWFPLILPRNSRKFACRTVHSIILANRWILINFMKRFRKHWTNEAQISIIAHLLQLMVVLVSSIWISKFLSDSFTIWVKSVGLWPSLCRSSFLNSPVLVSSIFLSFILASGHTSTQTIHTIYEFSPRHYN